MAAKRTYGRIKKVPGEILSRKGYGPGSLRTGRRQITVKVFVDRGIGANKYSKASYEAVACIRGATFRKGASGCGHTEGARTPQSAVAKALKSLAIQTALRGKRGRK